MEFNNVNMGSVNFNASFNGPNTRRQTPMAAAPLQMNNMGQQQYDTPAVPADDSIDFRSDSFNNINFGMSSLDGNFNFNMPGLDTPASNPTFEQAEIARLNTELTQQTTMYNDMVRGANDRYLSFKQEALACYNGVVEVAKIASAKAHEEKTRLQQQCAVLSTNLQKACNQIRNDRNTFNRYMAEQRANTQGRQAAQPPQQQHQPQQRQHKPIVIEDSVGDDEPLVVSASQKLAPQAATGEQPTFASPTQATPEASVCTQPSKMPATVPRCRKKRQSWAYTDKYGHAVGAVFGNGSVKDAPAKAKIQHEIDVKKWDAQQKAQAQGEGNALKRKLRIVDGGAASQPKKKQKKKEDKWAAMGDQAALLKQQEEKLRLGDDFKATTEKARLEVEAAEKERQQKLEAKEAEDAAAIAAEIEGSGDSEEESNTSSSQGYSGWSQEWEDELLAGWENHEEEEGEGEKWRTASKEKRRVI